MDFFNFQEWKNELAKLKAKAQDFVATYDRVKSQRGPSPELEAERQRILHAGDNARATIESVTRSADQAYRLYQSVFGGNGLNGLGAIQLIPMGIIVSAAALITKWLIDARTYLAKADRYIAAGGTPGALLAERTWLAAVMPWVFAGAVAFMILPRLNLKMFKGK